MSFLLQHTPLEKTAHGFGERKPSGRNSWGPVHGPVHLVEPRQMARCVFHKASSCLVVVKYGKMM